MPKFSGKFATYIAFGLALAIFISTDWLTYRNIMSAKQADKWTTHTYVVISELSSLKSALLDAETGERGYLITGNEGYLEPYNKALGVIYEKLGTLRDFVKDDPNQLLRLDNLQSLVSRKLEELKATIEIKEE